MAAKLKLTNSNNCVTPLNIDGARKLQLATEAYQAVSRGRPSEEISTSAPNNSIGRDSMISAIARHRSIDVHSFQSSVPSVTLEQVVHMEPRQAGGGSITKGKSPKVSDASPRSFDNKGRK
jgi:hypothetical protein